MVHNQDFFRDTSDNQKLSNTTFWFEWVRPILREKYFRKFDIRPWDDLTMTTASEKWIKLCFGRKLQFLRNNTKNERFLEFGLFTEKMHKLSKLNFGSFRKLTLRSILSLGFERRLRFCIFSLFRSNLITRSTSVECFIRKAERHKRGTLFSMWKLLPNEGANDSTKLQPTLPRKAER